MGDQEARGIILAVGEVVEAMEARVVSEDILAVLMGPMGLRLTAETVEMNHKAVITVMEVRGMVVVGVVVEVVIWIEIDTRAPEAEEAEVRVVRARFLFGR
jgi:hypothetical protein